MRASRLAISACSSSGGVDGNGMGYGGGYSAGRVVRDVIDFTLVYLGVPSDKTVDLYRTLRREYLVPGDAVARGSTEIPLAKGKNRRGTDCEFEFQIAGKPAGCWIYR